MLYLLDSSVKYIYMPFYPCALVYQDDILLAQFFGGSWANALRCLPRCGKEPATALSAMFRRQAVDNIPRKVHHEICSQGKIVFGIFGMVIREVVLKIADAWNPL